MSTYNHISTNERESILFLLGKGETVRKIAKELNRSPSTILRELRRNIGKKQTYSPTDATAKYIQRRKRCRKKRTFEGDSELKTLVMSLIRDRQWSPEQVSGRLKLEQVCSVSYNSIYRAIWQRDFETCKLPKNVKGFEKYLRRKGRKRTKTIDNRGKMPIEHSIFERPQSAESREVIGHYEADTVLGFKNTGCVLTLVERKSRYLLTAFLPDRTAGRVGDAIAYLLKNQKVLSVTPDQGKEFAEYKRVSEELETIFYFPPPATPWLRGTNENTNGLLREYMPKRKSFQNYTSENVKEFTNKLNLRPRKSLGWQTPYEIFFNKVLHLA